MILLLGDVTGEIALINSLEKSFYFIALAFGDHLNPAIWKITHSAGHIVAAGDLPHRYAKAHALHPACIEYRHTLHEYN